MGNEKKKVYLCGSYEEKGYLLEVEDYLKQNGFESVSRWLHAKDNDKRMAAFMDLEDIDRCDVFVHIIPTGLNMNTYIRFHTGGRHFETGYAYAKGKKIVKLSVNEENIFDNILDVFSVTSIQDIDLKELS